MIQPRPIFGWLALCVMLAGAVYAPAFVLRVTSHATALDSSRESKERVIGWTRRQIDALCKRHTGEPFKSWPDIDKFSYQAMRRGLLDLGEKCPEEPIP